MIYKDFQGKQLSMLGLGAMRLPLRSNDDADIDVEKTKEMVAYAMESIIMIRHGDITTDNQRLFSAKR